jgi:hypothetical protein
MAYNGLEKENANHRKEREMLSHQGLEREMMDTFSKLVMIRKVHDNRKIKFNIKYQNETYEVIGFKEEEKKVLSEGNQKIKSTYVIEYINKPQEQNSPETNIKKLMRLWDHTE